MLRILLLLATIFIGGVFNPAHADRDSGRTLRPDEMAAMSNGTYKDGSTAIFYGASRILSASMKYDLTTRWRNRTLWCADYVNQVLSDVHIRGTNSRAAGSFLTWGQRVTAPQPGDVVVLAEKNGRTVRHVGFFVRMNGNKVVIHSGNTRTGKVSGRTVAENEYPQYRVLQYRRATTQLAAM